MTNLTSVSAPIFVAPVFNNFAIVDTSQIMVDFLRIVVEFNLLAFLMRWEL